MLRFNVKFQNKMKQMIEKGKSKKLIIALAKKRINNINAIVIIIFIIILFNLFIVIYFINIS